MNNIEQVQANYIKQHYKFDRKVWPKFSAKQPRCEELGSSQDLASPLLPFRAHPRAVSFEQFCVQRREESLQPRSTSEHRVKSLVHQACVLRLQRTGSQSGKSILRCPGKEEIDRGGPRIQKKCDLLPKVSPNGNGTRMGSESHPLSRSQKCRMNLVKFTSIWAWKMAADDSLSLLFIQAHPFIQRIESTFRKS